MKSHCVFWPLSVAAAVMALAGGALAQAEQPGRASRQRESRLAVAQVPVAVLQEVCKLTPEQVTKIREIQEKLEAELRELRRQPGAQPDETAAQKRREATQRASREITDLLTPEQRQALRQAAAELESYRSLNLPLEILPELGLTAEQKAKLREIATGIREKMANVPAEERRAKMRELVAEARSKIEDVLTPEQKEKLNKFRQENRQRAGRRREAPPVL